MNIKRWSALLLIAACSYASPALAQTDDDSTATQENSEALMAMLENDAGAKPARAYTTATFKSTRIANGHSIENVGKGVLDFRIMHRFGVLKNGFDDFFGLDGANTMIGFDYGITDWLMIGVARSGFMKEYNGFFKVKLLRQTDNSSMPVSLSYMGGGSALGQKMISEADTREYFFSNRVAYINQILLARKFSNAFSLQLMPTQIHYNLVEFRDEPNDVLALGVGGRLKLSNRISLTAEYYYTPDDYKLRGSRNPLTIGFDIETGGHVFQLLFSNSQAVSERNVIGHTTDNWSDGGIHFGFNISRVFTIVKPKEFKDSRNKIW